MERGTLYLVPVPIDESGDPLYELAPRVIHTLLSLRCFIVENTKTARRLLSRIMPQDALDASTLYVLDEHSIADDIELLLEPLMRGNSAALISEAGCPCVADPGSMLVERAAAKNIACTPLAGPSSILMALMASGMQGQHFCFHGYLPPDKQGRETALRRIEASSARENSTRIFIETPYRNDALLESALRVLKPHTVLCAALGVASSNERIMRMSIQQWKENKTPLGKTPCVFLLYTSHDRSK